MDHRLQEIIDILDLFRPGGEISVGQIVKKLETKFGAEYYVGYSGNSNTIWRLPELCTTEEEKKVMGYLFYNLEESTCFEGEYYFLVGKMGNTSVYRIKL